MYLLLSLFIAGIASATNPEELIKNSPTKAQYPNAGAVVLLDRQVLKINEDKTSSVSRELIVKVFDDRGKAEYGDIKTHYNAGTQTFELIKACTYTSDGRVVKPEFSAITDLSAPEVLNAAAYTNAKVKIVSFPALEPNAVINFKYKLANKKDKYFFGEVVFTGREPILRKEFKIVAPKNIKFKHIIVNSDVVPQIEEKGNTVTYLWVIENIVPIVTEPDMPAFSEIAPRLVYSSFDSWDEVSKYLSEPFYKSMVINKRMGDELTTLAKGKTPEDIIRICFLKVMTEYRNIRIPVGAAGYVPNRADKVYYNKYGDSRDKAVLLCALLKGAGINASPMFINKDGVSLIKDIPSPTMFNWMLVVVQHEAGWFLLDPLATTADLGYMPEEVQGVEGLILFKDSYVFKPTMTMQGDKNLSSSSMHLILSDSGDLKGEIFTELSGLYSRRARYAMQDKTPKELDMMLENNTSRFGTSAKFVSHFVSDLKDVTVPVEINVSFETQKFCIPENKEMKFFIPVNPFSFSDIEGFVGLNKRNYGLRLLTARVIEENTDIAIPEGFVLDGSPKIVEIENEFGTLSISEDMQSNKLVYKSRLEIKPPYIPATDYSKFVSFISEFTKPQTRWVTLKYTGAKTNSTSAEGVAKHSEKKTKLPASK
ncbi:MAG: DUF3857 domain-containing protein [bacterium]|nr:DUF3857 domain-containing protein [bacterium]